jgi:predicted Fe-Mo cluster-binding NifX family protein
MRIVVSATDGGLQAEASRVFGRCPQYVFLDTETMEYETLENPAAAAGGGAGIQAAEFVIRHGAKAVVTGHVGPNAARVLEAAEVAVYLLQEGTVGEVAKAYRDGLLRQAPGQDERSE